jgi:hypothetical protein
MLAEYRTLFPIAMFCTIAVRTGTGDLAGIVDSLQAASIRAAAEAAMAASRKTFHLMYSLFPESFIKVRLRAPEGQQALLVFMIGIGSGCLLL